MQVQLYGHFSDYGSFAGVSRALMHEIRARRLQAAIYEIGTMFPRYLEIELPIEVDSHAPIGIAVTYPPQAAGWLRGHTTRILVTVCESDRVPDRWIAAANEATLVLVPSRFCYDAFKRSGLRAPIEVLHHGVRCIGDGSRASNASRMLNDTRINNASRTTDDTQRIGAHFLHVSGALSFPARKGTSQLLLAFKRLLREYPESMLLLKMPRTDSIQRALSHVGLDGHVEFVAADETSDPRAMAELYRSVDAVVQPSRGEGFGLVPLEARCVGTPAIYTNDTGHREHFHTPSCPLIDTYEATLLLTQGNECGYAPTVTVEAVYRALKDFVENRDAWTRRAAAWMQAHAHEWTWSVQLRPFLNWLAREATATPPRGLVPGEDASLRGL